LQRHGREGDEAIGLGGAQLGELLVLQLDDGLRDVAIRLVPERIDAQRFDVDALRIHVADALVGHDQIWRFGLDAHQGHGFGKRAVRVHVDRRHAPPADHDVAPPGGRVLRLDVPGAQEVAADEDGAGQTCGGVPDKLSSRRHVVLTAA